MKHTLTILIPLIFGWSSLIANPTDKTTKAKEDPNNTSNKESTTDQKVEDESFYIMEQKTGEVEMHRSEVPTNQEDPDSSYYSVNKFNYLFYYLYKVKYLGIDEVEVEP